MTYDFVAILEHSTPDELFTIKCGAGPKDVAYGALLKRFIADQTMNNGPESQYLDLKPQFMELSNVFNNSKNDWVMVEKNAGGYISQLKMDDKDKNPKGGNCYNCGSTNHNKKQCSKTKAAGGSRGGKKNGGKGDDSKNKWFNENSDGKTEMKKNGSLIRMLFQDRFYQIIILFILLWLL